MASWLSALARTRHVVSGALRRVLGRPRVDAATAEELEELLVRADVEAVLAAEIVRTLEHADGAASGSRKDALAGLLARRLPARSFEWKTGHPPLSILVVGVNGSGKTTTCAKLGAHLKRSGKRVILAAADIYRPAAAEQLEILAGQADCIFFKSDSNDVAKICSQAVEAGVRKLADAVILDTAGRLHIDAEMMAELVRTKAAARPHEILLVLDSMTGQDAANVAAEFNTKLGLTGAILTKLDSDARGGAALSLRAVSGAPIKFVGVGEKLADLEEFHPDRMASRILGMGDIVTLVEKAQAAFDAREAARLEEKAQKDRLTLEDFAEQMRQARKMGSLQDLAGLIPGMPKAAQAEVDEKALARMEAIISSMTPKERRNPQVFNGSRRQRVARGSGTTVQEVNQLLRQFEAAQKLMRMMGKKRGARVPMPFGM